jgi:hypothetical protein
VQYGTNRVRAPTARDHAALLFILAKALWRLQPGRFRGLEVLGSDGGGDWRGVGALDIRRIRDPSCGAKGGVVQDIGVDIDQPFADTVLDRREVRGPEQVQDEAAAVSCGA